VRELLRAVVTATPLATMLEPEVNKGGMTIEQIEAQVRAMYEPCEKHGTQFANKLTMWGLDKEVRTKERPPRDKPSRHAPSEECRRVKATCPLICRSTSQTRLADTRMGTADADGRDANGSSLCR
jgi:hypothetical protein